MSEHQHVLQWIEGYGWLVLSGGNDALSDIRAMALSKMKAGGGVAYLVLQEDAADDLIEDMNELGAPTGYIVNVLTEDDATINQRLQEAQLIVLPLGVSKREVLSVLKGAALDAMKAAYERGAVILAEGEASSLFGKLFLVGNEGFDGLAWLPDVLVVTGVTSLNDEHIAQDVLTVDAAAVAVGIGAGSALALGPLGAVETWGAAKVTIGLGRSFG
jgi:hypothetical protein